MIGKNYHRGRASPAYPGEMIHGIQQTQKPTTLIEPKFAGKSALVAAMRGSKTSAVERRLSAITDPRALEHCIQELKGSFPLLKIDLEKIELDVAELRVKTRKEESNGYLLRKDATPLKGKVVSPAERSAGTRVSSLSRKADHSSDTIRKIQHIEEKLKYFKSSLVGRERVVLDLINMSMEWSQHNHKLTEYTPEWKVPLHNCNEPKQLLILQYSEKYEAGRNVAEHHGEGELEGQIGLYKRLEELQRENQDLANQLQRANKKLTEGPPSQGFAKTTSGFYSSKQRGHSQNTHEVTKDWEIEKKELNAKLQGLRKEIDRSMQNQAHKSREQRESYNRRLEFYLGKLKTASISVHRFLGSMQRLQKGVLNHSERNIDHLRKDFELNKAQIIALSKELKAFEEAEGQCLSSDSSQSSLMAHSGTNPKAFPSKTIDYRPTIHYEEELKRQIPKKYTIERMENTKNETGKQLEIDNIKLQDENQRLCEEISLLKSEIHKLSEAHKALMSETQVRRSPDGMEDLFEKYQKTVSFHEQNESRMKKSLSDLEYSLKLKENENNLLHQRRIKETTLAKTKLFSLIKKISTKLFSNMNQMYALISKQFPLIESLKEKLGYKFIQFSEELYSANTVIEKLTEENTGYRMQIADLELSLQHPSQNRDSELQEKNVRLQSEIAALESKLKESPSKKEYSKLLTDYSTLEKKYTRKINISTLNLEIEGLKTNIESAKQDVLIVEHSRRNTSRRNREQSDQMKTLKKDCETASQDILLQCNQTIDGLQSKLLNLEGRLKLLYELCRQLAQKNKSLKSSTDLANQNTEYLTSQYHQDIEKINKKYKDMFFNSCSRLLSQENLLQSQISTQLLKISERIQSIPFVKLQSTINLLRKTRDQNKFELKTSKEIIAKSKETCKTIIGFIVGQNMMDETEDDDSSLELSLVVPTLKSKILIIMKRLPQGAIDQSFLYEKQSFCLQIMKKIIQMQLEKRTAIEEKIKKLTNAILKLISFSRRPLQRIKSRYADFFRKMKNQEKLLSTKTEEIRTLNLKLEEQTARNIEITNKAETDSLDMAKCIEEKNQELL